MWTSLALRLAMQLFFRGMEMNKLWKVVRSWFRSTRVVLTSLAVLFLAAPAFAQAGTSPWENAVSVLQTAFTSTIARGLSLVAIVVAGLTFAFAQ
jgi:type IV secretion system protein TrbC